MQAATEPYLDPDRTYIVTSFEPFYSIRVLLAGHHDAGQLKPESPLLSEHPEIVQRCRDVRQRDIATERAARQYVARGPRN